MQNRRYNRFIISPTTGVLTEDNEAELLAGYLLKLQEKGKIELYSHIPHETYTKLWSIKVKNKRQGVRAGVPDYIITTSSKVIFLELKRTKNSSTTPEQKQWLASLPGKTTEAVVCKGYLAAKMYLQQFL